MQELERKVDVRNLDMVDNLRREFEKMINDKSDSIQDNNRSIKSLVTILESRLDQTSGDLVHTFN